jgi:hypothetical protein
VDEERELVVQPFREQGLDEVQAAGDVDLLVPLRPIALPFFVSVVEASRP